MFSRWYVLQGGLLCQVGSRPLHSWTVGCVPKLPRVAVQAPWLCGTRDCAQQLGREAGLALLCHCRGSLARLPRWAGLEDPNLLPGQGAAVKRVATAPTRDLNQAELCQRGSLAKVDDEQRHPLGSLPRHKEKQVLGVGRCKPRPLHLHQLPTIPAETPPSPDPVGPWEAPRNAGETGCPPLLLFNPLVTRQAQRSLEAVLRRPGEETRGPEWSHFS